VSEHSRRHRVADSLQVIIDNIASIRLYVGDLDAEGLAADRLRYDAVERCLERVCEAAFRLGDEAETLMPDQVWRAIRGMGNRLRHAYDQIDFKVIWEVVATRLTQLKNDAMQALERWLAEGEA
jgi:uncharacterized protein with HEPN domain